jgi:hypothetical protein
MKQWSVSIVGRGRQMRSGEKERDEETRAEWKKTHLLRHHRLQKLRRRIAAQPYVTVTDLELLPKLLVRTLFELNHLLQSFVLRREPEELVIVAIGIGADYDDAAFFAVHSWQECLSEDEMGARVL